MTFDQFLKFCRCPQCRSDLTAAADQSTLVCTQGHRFELLRTRYPVFLRQADKAQHPQAPVTDLKTSESFSAQWQMRKTQDSVWGWNIDDMKNLLLTNVRWKESDFAGKQILDLGCGHGLFTRIMAEWGADVIGFDISNGFLKTAETLPSSLQDRIHFVQGDVFHFPLKEETVDLVWCSGVLHHTPDTKKAFNHVCRVVKRGGRFYIWLYKNVYYTPLLKAIRQVTTKIPERILVLVCYLLAPFFALAKFLLTVFRMNYRTFERKSLRENALSIHDTLAPPYRWHHEQDEITGWFKEAGFTNITVSEDSPLGYGIFGDRA